MKKKNAIMIADTRPALIGNLLVQLNDTNKGLFEEAIIYYDEITENDKKIMQKIMPCRFIKYNDNFSDSVKNIPAFQKFSTLMFSRYYMFDFLNEYETVTWLDTDVLICGKLDPIIKIAKKYGMAANFEDEENKSYLYTDTVKTSFSEPIDNYDMNRYNMSSGLITISDTLKNKELMTKWCFDKTIEYANKLILPDQGILNILIQEFNIEVGSVGENGAYCFYPSYKRDEKNAKIIHSWGSRKFWKSWYLYKTYPKWNEYYKKWINLGGSDCFGEINPEVSIIIPIYNPNIEYLREVFEDLLVKQVDEHYFQYDNFEMILVVDGNNNEGLLKLVKEFDDPRINIIINKERAGIAKSLNIGIKESKGKFIARIDDDDRINKTRLWKQVKYLNENKEVHLVTSNFEYFGDMNEGRKTLERDMVHAWSIFTCPFDHPTIMFRKEYFIENELFYDESRSHVEDWELWLRAFKKGMVVGNIDEVLYYHRWYNGQAGQNNKTVTMMRELVKSNFKELDVDLTEEDVLLVSPWQGKIVPEKMPRLKEIFTKALNNNKNISIYNQDALKQVFDYRLEEAKTGKLSELVFEKTKNNSCEHIKLRTKIKRKILGPFYRRYKRVQSNIIKDSVLEILNNNSSQENLTSMQKDIIKLKEELRYLHDNFYDYNKEFQFVKNIELNNLYFKKKIFLVGTSEHSNIGDAAISMGEYEFIRKYFNDYYLIELSTYEFNDYFKYMQNIINPDDLIFLQGGGNIGNKYLNEENLRRTVIPTFPNNKIIILPQTIYFDNTEEGKKEYELSKNIYNHNNLLIFTRGNISLKQLDSFENIEKHPTLDMALNLNLNYSYERKGILACIRNINDESNFTYDEYKKLLNILEKQDKNYEITENIYTFDIRKEDRSKIVYEQLEKFAKHEIVVTDRLHGLIFSLITNTPCVVFSSYNYKLKEFIELLKENENVIFIDNDIEKLESSIKKLKSKDISKYNNNYEKQFSEIAKIINDFKN